MSDKGATKSNQHERTSEIDDSLTIEALRRLGRTAGVAFPLEANLDEALEAVQTRASAAEEDALLARACDVLLAAGGRKQPPGGNKP